MKREPITDGQESVWDYPRPPALDAVREQIRIEFAGRTIVDSKGGYRVLETSHPPTIYVPKDAILHASLIETPHRTFCEWKGVAHYYDIRIGDQNASQAAWSYANPNKSFAKITDYVAFYPSRMEACFLDDERVLSQKGDFYGGWITSKIAGPFKGGPGTMGW